MFASLDAGWGSDGMVDQLHGQLLIVQEDMTWEAVVKAVENPVTQALRLAPKTLPSVSLPSRSLPSRPVAAPPVRKAPKSRPSRPAQAAPPAQEDSQHPLKAVLGKKVWSRHFGHLRRIQSYEVRTPPHAHAPARLRSPTRPRAPGSRWHRAHAPRASCRQAALG